MAVRGRGMIKYNILKGWDGTSPPSVDLKLQFHQMRYI